MPLSSTSFENLTIIHCEAFLKNPSINPLTGRKLTSDAPGSIKSKLKKRCNELNVPVSSCAIAPMGPFIHFNYVDDTKYVTLDEKGKLAKFKDWISFVTSRIDQIQKDTTINVTEVDDLIKMTNGFKKHITDENNKYVTIDSIVKALKSLKRKKEHIDISKAFDTPSWYNYALTRDKFTLRNDVVGMYGRVMSSIAQMERCIKNPKHTSYDIDDSDVVRMKRYEEFLNILIDKCYFREEDIFGGVFKDGRKVFERLQKTYDRFKKLK